MADDCKEMEQSTTFDKFEELIDLIWGPDLKEEVFMRWSQGFVFSADEPSALVQEQGGPCATIAAVQAHLLKNMLYSDGITATSNWRQITDDQVQHMLICTLCQMLRMAQGDDDEVNITVALLRDHTACTSTTEMHSKTNTDVEQSSLSSSTEYHRSVCHQALSVFTSKELHSCLSQIECDSMESTRAALEKYIHIFEGRFGILMFLYSMILTRGIETIRSEMEDPGEPLVDQRFGHGSQTLINLLITGYAMSNVWDFSKEVSGLELRGIPKRSEIGFLTLLEAHRYCEVGSFFKCPEYPVWVLGSETHLTVLFSQDRSLTGTELPSDEARRVFKSFDQQENGFIESDKLTNVLEELRLETDPEYIEFMKSRLDPDSMGIILLPNFLEEFFPGQNTSLQQHTNPFTVFHYNGLGVRADEQTTKKVVYTEGIASIEPTDFSRVAEQEIVTCLKTKWPGIAVDWQSKHPPSVN